MQDITMYKRRIRQFIDLVYEGRYSDNVPLRVSYIYDQQRPIPYDRALEVDFKPIETGTEWGKLWGSAWFRFEGTVPASHAGKDVVALIDIDGEGCVFVEGIPDRGLTPRRQREGSHTKRRVPVGNPAGEGEVVSILVEAGANELFGEAASHEFTLRQAELAVFHADRWQLGLDFQVLFDLAESLPQGSPRADKILHGLNDAANLWNEGEGIDACKAIAKKLFAPKAYSSDMTVWSIGHAHIDLGWLWPVRETRRKGGRTFSTALRMMEEYPEYRFGASQPQLYEWIKEDYPTLYAQVKEAVADGKWECQGAMWVEPDTNITGGESLVRQCLYGKRFFREEMGKDVRNLWLPDVFGYSAALPQILKKSGVDIFMTQKISWNETNFFPHHTFVWEGIDGTKILTHFLPTNNYNFENTPKALLESQKRFAQSDVQDDFLNLYGIGDGGGGPSRMHIERARRLTNTEGSPKVKFAFAEDFFKKIAKTPETKLPLWCGELYLELHRGTLTTQARIKQYNRSIENLLRDTEILSIAAGMWPEKELDSIWKETLLNQFHDILPGSSIGLVYRDAHEVSERNIAALLSLRTSAIARLTGVKEPAGGGSSADSASSTSVAVFNTLSWQRTEVIDIKLPGSGSFSALDSSGTPLPCCRTDGSLLVLATVPSIGYTTINLQAGEPAPLPAGTVQCGEDRLENDLVRVRLAEDGAISSIYDKKARRELVADRANRLQLWEDLPYSWDAWDVSRYYRETEPEQALLRERRVVESSPLRCTIYQKLTVGASTIEQRISLSMASRFVRIENTVDWKESKKLLKVHAETSVQSRKATYEIQYGLLERPTHQNTSWDLARFEVAGHRFADISQQDFGIALLNDCKYGYSAYGSSLELSLLRSPKNPDPDADMAVHSFTYGYLAHKGSLCDSGVFEASHELNTPMILASVATPPSPMERSFFKIRGRNVKIEAVKQAESGEGIAVRLYETAGTSAVVRLESEKGWQNVTETNLLEQPVRRPSGPGNSVRLKFTPFEIKTLVLR